MGLHPAIDDDPVRLGGKPIDVDIPSLIVDADFHDLHRGADRAAKILLRAAVVLHDPSLAFRRCAAMAPHGRDDKGFRAPALAEIHNGFRNYGHIRDTAAAHCDRDFHARPDPLRDRLLIQKRAQGVRDVLRLDPGPGENLFDPEHLRQLNISHLLRNGRPQSFFHWITLPVFRQNAIMTFSILSECSEKSRNAFGASSKG